MPWSIKQGRSLECAGMSVGWEGGIYYLNFKYFIVANSFKFLPHNAFEP